MDYSRYHALAVSTKDNVLTITIDRPTQRNAIGSDLHEELSHIFDDVDRDPDAHVVVLTGAGGYFSAGGDLDWVLSIHGDPVRTSAAIRNDRRIQNSMLDLEKPLIAKVRGAAIGLGCSLALFADFVFATPEAKFADPHVSVGLVAGDGGAVIWPQLVGLARARRYLLTGDAITGAEAASIGLITAAVPDDELDDEVDRWALRIAAGAPFAIRWTKAAINAGLKVTANAVIDRGAAFENVTQFTSDNRAALEAFKAKTAPVFSGR